MDKKPRQDLLCRQCFSEEANTLLYYRKDHPCTKEVSFKDPMFICEGCKQQIRSMSRLFDFRPVYLNFERLAVMEYPQIIWLTSDKGKAQNDMEGKVWRKKLLRVKKVWLAGLEKSLKEVSLEGHV